MYIFKINKNLKISKKLEVQEQPIHKETCVTRKPRKKITILIKNFKIREFLLWCSGNESD